MNEDLPIIERSILSEKMETFRKQILTKVNPATVKNEAFKAELRAKSAKQIATEYGLPYDLEKLKVLYRYPDGKSINNFVKKTLIMKLTEEKLAKQAVKSTPKVEKETSEGK